MNLRVRLNEYLDRIPTTKTELNLRQYVRNGVTDKLAQLNNSHEPKNNIHDPLFKSIELSICRALDSKLYKYYHLHPDYMSNDELIKFWNERK
jgi:hypothetical protein